MNNTAIRDMRRGEIITAACDLFSHKGYHGTTIPDIAHVAGISTGLIYYIFPSKEDILLACCENTATLHLTIFEHASTLSHPLERFDAIVRELYTMLDRAAAAPGGRRPNPPLVSQDARRSGSSDSTQSSRRAQRRTKGRSLK